jgi:ATP-binding protein involved in chromosome partitioning
MLRAILLVDPKMAEMYERVRLAAQEALEGVDGVDKVSVLLTAHKAAPDVSRKPARSGNPHKVRRPEGYQGDAFVDHVIAISSAKGGVGKSTMAVNIAVAMAKQGQKVGLLDADIHGPSAPILLGLKEGRAKAAKKNGRQLIQPLEAFGIKVMSIGFLTDNDGPIVWRGPMVQGAISKMLWDVDWGELDYLIIDMPPGTGDPQLGLAQDIKPRGAVIVSTPQDLALADARKGVQMFEKVDIPVIGIVENMSVFICPDCGSSHDIFGTGGAKLEAEKMDVPFLGAAPLHMSIRVSGDEGVPIASRDGKEADMFGAIASALVKVNEAGLG